MIVAKCRRRNRPSGTSGFGRRAMRNGKATSAMAPMASAAHATGSCQLRSVPRIAPNASPPTAITATAAPEPVERAGCLLGARLGHVADGREQGDRDERHVDEERRAPADAVDEQAADDGAEERRRRCRRRPDADRAGAGRTFEQRREDREAARDEQRAGRALEEPGDDEQLERRGEAAQDRGDAEAGEADREDPAAAVVVAQRAGEDEQRGEDREVAADGVGLALEPREDACPGAPRRCAAGRGS